MWAWHRIQFNQAGHLPYYATDTNWWPTHHNFILFCTHPHLQSHTHIYLLQLVLADQTCSSSESTNYYPPSSINLLSIPPFSFICTRCYMFLATWQSPPYNKHSGPSNVECFLAVGLQRNVCAWVRFSVSVSARWRGRQFKWPTNHFVPVLQRHIISHLQRIIIYSWTPPPQPPYPPPPPHA